MKITERIKTLQDALDYNGETLEQFNARTAHDTDNQKASKELEVIAQALNEGEVMTYKDTDIWKYFPVFCAVGSGRGFVSAATPAIARTRLSVPASALSVANLLNISESSLSKFGIGI